MIMNLASMMCDKKKEFKSNSFSENCIKFCYSENRHTDIKCGFKPNKRQDIYKIRRRHHHLKIKKMLNKWTSRKTIGLKKNI